ncbi:MAG: DUF1919 domain-containing protein [Ruminococcaceae bacterium]|nr:DUF1919 domain-containing protein [Oscillospiraceae bacterium]
MIKRIYKKLASVFMSGFRKIHYKKMKKQPKNENFSIIASDCFGTFVYHSLGLQFLSPTINLFFSKKDFWTFVNDLEGFFAAELYEVKDHGQPYPIGKLEHDGKSIQINFMHYKTFEEAKEKWNERKQRVNFSNLYIVQIIAAGVNQDDIDNFEKIPYKNKLLITKENDLVCKDMVTHPVFSKKNYKPGEILAFKHDFAVSRNMDDLDYISFLNSK